MNSQNGMHLFKYAVYDVVKHPLDLIGVQITDPGAWNVHLHFSDQGSQLADEFAQNPRILLPVDAQIVGQTCYG
jgi:hypothetical protein